MARDFEWRSGIRCQFNTRIAQMDMGIDRSALLFQIVQEVLTNVFQHAGATRVTVSLRGSHKWVTVAVADNGRDVSKSETASGSSRGLIGMRERAVLLDGSLGVRRRRPAGTLVTLTIPVRGPSVETPDS